jgi:hypothetical protein
MSTLYIYLEPDMLKKILCTLILLASFHAFAQAEPIITDSTSRSTSVSETTVKSPPPSAIAPAITSINSDLCTVGVSGAVQTQILGFSSGMTTRDMNCERLKISKTLYDMGMKVAAVASLCQDERVFMAMQNAGTPCPIDGKIGDSAKEMWDANPDRKPGTLKSEKVGLKDEKADSTSSGSWFSKLFSSN